ncbi:hypothetical protein [Marinobacterium arenosum]|uniref:hypothetical protein n=1 Tax=Marinobacterium arenosum TaxID=2862496 RepID=UPI001C972972|nr:hypothetical protein [Marinobacterium arenosum]MBY4675851.1 hypothetical protein [Marinobacterium arenosum]
MFAGSVLDFDSADSVRLILPSSLQMPLSAGLISESLKQQVATLATNTAVLSLIGLVLCALPVVLKLKLIQKKSGWSAAKLD